MIASPRRLSCGDRVLLGIVAALSVAAFVGSELEDRAYYRWRALVPLQMQKQPESLWPASIRDWKRPVRRRLQAFNSGLIVASLGLAFVAFRPGRNARPRRRGPGHAAIALGGGLVATSLGFVAERNWLDPFVTGYWPTYEPGEPSMPWTDMTSGLDPTVAGGIIPAWIFLAATGHWRASPDPLEMLGRWLGWGWIAAIVVNWVQLQVRPW